MTAPLTFSVLGPILAEFLGLHPEVQIERVCSDRRVDLIEDRFDLALRAGPNPDSSLVARKLGVVRRCLFGSPKLVAQTGNLEHPKDLERHQCTGFGFGLLPEYPCVEDLAAGRLARVLTSWSVADAPVFALYPSTRHVSPKLTAMLDLLQARLKMRLDTAEESTVP